MMSFEWPSELEFLEFFLVEPEKQDTLYFYNVTDSRKVNLVFSFDVMNNSIQTVLRIKGTEVSSVIMEGLRRIWIDNTNKDKPYLRAKFLDKDVIKLNLSVKPQIQVDWSGLIN